MPIDIVYEKHYTPEEKIRGLRFNIIHQTLIAQQAKRNGLKDIEFEAGLRRELVISATNQIKESGKLA